jgi:tRNA (guanine37-N1)-methyltransferase
MVMKVEPIDRALLSVPVIEENVPVVLMTPQGELFCQKMAEELAGYPQLILICGHYEGVDERVRTHLANREISIGDYVLTGGELSAMVIVDAVSRLVPGVLGNCESASSDSFSMGLLEYPHYTRPAEYRGWEVPEVLLNGNHREIESWRRREALLRTREKRPDLLRDRVPTAEEKKWLNDLNE